MLADPLPLVAIRRRRPDIFIIVRLRPYTPGDTDKASCGPPAAQRKRIPGFRGRRTEYLQHLAPLAVVLVQGLMGGSSSSSAVTASLGTTRSSG
ncbi:hypothetical protein DL770_007589 [Monosporascus sp. CRB-9-2]|nr:hypothetical protein DL770_007589 [Monosporascus sp. CRB-9-2]